MYLVVIVTSCALSSGIELTMVLVTINFLPFAMFMIKLFIELLIAAFEITVKFGCFMLLCYAESHCCYRVSTCASHSVKLWSHCYYKDSLLGTHLTM